MERITRRLANGSIEFVDGKGYANMSHADGMKVLFERLASYEDTGYFPPEVHTDLIPNNFRNLYIYMKTKESDLKKIEEKIANSTLNGYVDEELIKKYRKMKDDYNTWFNRTVYIREVSKE